jgi:hypothetical protein
MKDVFQLISREDLTVDLQLIFDICGMDIVVQLIKNLSGLSIYIPKISHLDTLVEKYIKSHPQKNYKEIAKDLNVSEPYLKNLVKRKSS